MMTDVDDDLRASLGALSRLATGQMQLDDVLTRVAELAVAAIPGADGAGLMLVESDRPDVHVTTDPFVTAADEFQYAIAQGPSVSAVAEERTVRTGSLAADPRWPRFGPRSARQGTHSVLAIPLGAPPGALGCLNLYGRAPDAFDDEAVRIAELFAAPAGIAVENAQALARAQRLAAQLQDALTNRATIDHAIGIVMSRVGCGPDEAFGRLRQISQAENQKLHLVALRVVGEAVGRARARHLGP